MTIEPILITMPDIVHPIPCLWGHDENPAAVQRHKIAMQATEIDSSLLLANMIGEETVYSRRKEIPIELAA